ncbi:MAG: ABC transporter [Methanoculleus sp. SDB]|nr:MAG: ABC transporter [Methanoculleus sp. SDB]
MITARNLKKIYTMGRVEVHALNGVSFDIGTGEFVGIMGSSGSGKSTLLHMLGLLDDPTEGEITIGGEDVLEFSDSKKTRFRLQKFGFIFQDYALVPELSALENVILPALARGVPLPDASATGRDYLDRVDLAGRKDHLPAELSGGEQQRVAIARALVNNPDILFADEPCANLDSMNSRAVLDLFGQINEELNQTVIMVSHEDWHREYFDRVIRLRDGKIEKEEVLREKVQ